MAYFRRNVRDPGPGGGQVPRTRTVARAEAAELGFFGKAGDAPVVLRADPQYVVPPLVPAKEGRTLLDVYTSGAIKYPWAENAYLMFPTEYYHYGAQLAEFRTEAPTNAGAVDTRFASSRDGFVSLRAGFTGGEFTTPLLRFAGAQLLLNVDTGAAGEVRVEILDTGGRPFPGFALGDCDRIHTANEINRVVKWQGSTSLPKLAGQPVRLRFVRRDTDLFAFQFAERGGI